MGVEGSGGVNGGIKRGAHANGCCRNDYRRRQRKVMNWVYGWAVENDKFVHVIGYCVSSLSLSFYKTKALCLIQ